MLTLEETNLIAIVVLRFQRLARERALNPQRMDDDLMDLLTEVHELQPLDLKTMSDLSDLDLVLAVQDICIHYNVNDAHRIKDNFRSRYAL